MTTLPAGTIIELGRKMGTLTIAQAMTFQPFTPGSKLGKVTMSNGAIINAKILS